MNNKLLSYFPQVVQILTLILVAFLVFSPSSLKLGGTTNYDALDVTDGYYVDGTVVIDGSGNLSLSGRTITLGTNGGALSIARSTTATWNPDSVTTSTNVSTIVLTPYATAGDSIVASLSSTTSTDLWSVDAKVTAGSGTATASTTIYLRGLGTAVDLSTTTIRLLWIR